MIKINNNFCINYKLVNNFDKDFQWNEITVVFATRFQVVQSRFAAEFDFFLLQQSSVIFEFMTDFERAILDVDALQQSRLRVVLEFRFGDAGNDPVQPGFITVDVKDPGIQSWIRLWRHAALVVEEDVERIAIDGRVVDEFGRSWQDLQGEGVDVSPRCCDRLQGADVVVVDGEAVASLGGEQRRQRRRRVFEAVRQFRVSGEDDFREAARPVVDVRFM